jgi:DNA mismatch endonuclease (patch repair protein)
MADSLPAEQRSERMRRVRQKDTALEVLVRKALHRRGLRYRLGGCGLPGRPDLVFPRHRAVVFVHGCFWHAHDCRFGRRPASNAEFWEQKAIANKERDARKEAELRALGWRVFVVWQCELAGELKVPCFERLAREIKTL